WVPTTTTFLARAVIFSSGSRDFGGRWKNQWRGASARTPCRPRRSARRAQRRRNTIAVGVENHAGVIVITAQLRKIKADRNRAGIGQRAQRGERFLQFGELRQLALGDGQHG